MGEQPAALGWRLQVPVVFLAALGVGIAVRAALLALPPLFVTDVAYYNAQAVSYLFRGVDPYGAAYTVPAALATPGAEKVFAYLPGVFAFLLPGDFGTAGRLGLVACDLVVASTLLLARPRPGGLGAALFLLFPPAVLFSTAFLNDSLPAIAFLSAAVLLEARGRPRVSALLMGVALASSLEAWLAFPAFLAFWIRGRRYAEPLISVAVGAAVVAPFLVWNPQSFVFDNFVFQFQRPAAQLLSSGPFGLNVNPSLQGILQSLGTGAPLALRGVLAAAFVALASWRSRPGIARVALGAAASAAVSLFLLAGNLFWSYLELPFVLVLFWAILKPGDGSSASMLKEPDRRVGTDS